MCRSAAGRAAPSFVIAVAVPVAALVGFLAWELLRVTPHQESEEIVRQFARSAAAEVGRFRRTARAMSRPTSGPTAAPQAIGTPAAEAVGRLERQAEIARERLDLVEGIPPRTHDNRLGRIERRLRESKAAIAAAGRRKERAEQAVPAD